MQPAASWLAATARAGDAVDLAYLDGHLNMLPVAGGNPRQNCARSMAN